jgi:hypothetical protein
MSDCTSAVRGVRSGVVFGNEGRGRPLDPSVDSSVVVRRRIRHIMIMILYLCLLCGHELLPPLYSP